MLNEIENLIEPPPPRGRPHDDDDEPRPERLALTMHPLPPGLILSEWAVGLLRAKPGSWGLSTANGWFLTKQSTGIYSTRPVEGPWERQDPAVIQRVIDALPHPEIV